MRINQFNRTNAKNIIINRKNNLKRYSKVQPYQCFEEWENKSRKNWIKNKKECIEIKNKRIEDTKINRNKNRNRNRSKDSTFRIELKEIQLKITDKKESSEKRGKISVL